MKWLVSLETESDPITGCRLMNIFRRKGVKIVTLAMTAQAAGYSLIALVDSPETEVEHIFNFLRRTAGVHEVTSYRHEPTADATFVFVNAERDPSSVTRLLRDFPESKVVFAGHGKYLLEVPAGGHPAAAVSGPGDAEFLPFARTKSSRSVPRPELVAAQAS